jgi:hypothetical protein
LTLSAVRGLALRPAYHLRPDEWPKEIAVLAAMVAHALTAGHAPAASRQRTVPRKPVAAVRAKPSRR